jgi:DHA3 family macrolide efflux protein-like MFS transporter
MRNLRTFYTLTVTQTLSLIGSQMTDVGVGIWVYARTGDVTPILLTSFFLEIPGFFVGGLAGVLADRWDRRHTMMLGDAGEAVGTLLLMFSFLSGHFQLWHLYAASLFKGVFVTFQEPAADAAITMLVPETHRERANGIKEMAFPLAGVIAPILSGMLYPLIGVMGIVLIDLLTFVAAVMVVFMLHIPRPAVTAEGAAAQGSMWQEMFGGLRFLIGRRALLGLVLYSTFVNFLLNGPLGLSIPYLTSITGSEATVGLLLGVMSAGALTGATIIAAWGGTRPRIHTLLPGSMLAGAAMIGYGVVRAPALLGAAVFVALMPLPVNNAVFKSLLQAKTPPDMQGRVFAFVFQLMSLSAPLSFLLTGPLVDRMIEPAVGGHGWSLVAPLVGTRTGAGMGLVILSAGAVIILTTVLVYVVPAIRHVEANLPDYTAVPVGE